MKTRWTGTIVVSLFVLTLGAGVAVGLLASRMPWPVRDREWHPTDNLSLAGQLSLSEEQSEQMRKIWEGVRDLSGSSYQDALKAERERDEAIFSLLVADKVDEYNKIKRTYAERCAVLQGRRQAAFDKAVEDTRRMLNPTQCVKYNEILSKRLGGEGFRSHESTHESASITPQS